MELFDILEEHADDMVVTKFQVPLHALSDSYKEELGSGHQVDQAVEYIDSFQLSREFVAISATLLLDLSVSLDAHVAICRLQGPIAGTAMRRSIQGMLEELEYNLWEHILCRLVDYGHTFSPEVHSRFSMSQSVPSRFLYLDVHCPLK